MRRYWMISLALGGGATLVVLALRFGGLFDPASEWLGHAYRSSGWTQAKEWTQFRWIESPLVALVAIGVASAIVEATREIHRALIGVLSFVVVATLSPILAIYGLFLEPFSLLAAVMLAGGGALLFARTDLGRRKRLLEDALGTRVSARVFANLLEGSGDPGFRGAQREVTTVVCRLFPSEVVAEGDPADEVKRGSLFLRAVSAFFLSRGAYLEEAGPEKVRASFGLLRDDDDHAGRACRAALDLRGRLRGLSQECESRWFVPIRWGIGIGSGRMRVGLFGEPGRCFFAGTGGEGDFADRLALANLRLESDLLMGPGCHRLVREGFEVRPLEMLYDPVRRGVVEIYQLLSTSEELSEEEKRRRDWFWQGVIRLREKNHEGALESFSRARVPGVEDAPLAILTGKAQDGIAAPVSRAARLIREVTDENRIRPISRL